MQPPAAIFINYRTGDGEHAATLIDQELTSRFGESNVFLARRSIPPSTDFNKGLIGGVRRSSVLLAVIGPGWLDAVADNGLRALDQDSDWIRREIAEAFDGDIPVLPVLLGSTPRLTGAELPPDMARLADCQYLRYDMRRSANDLEEIVKAVREIVPYLRPVQPGKKADRPAAAPTPAAPKYAITTGRDNHIYEGDVHFGGRA